MSSKIRHFEVLAGSHIEGSKEYNKGETVPCGRDLVAIFGDNKFKEVFPVAAPVEAPKKNDTQPPADTGAKSDAKSDDAPEGGDKGKLDHPDDTGRSELGENVTKSFPKAVEADLQVFKKGVWHYVVDPADPAEALNEKALKADQVDGFLAKYLKG